MIYVHEFIIIIDEDTLYYKYNIFFLYLNVYMKLPIMKLSRINDGQ